MEPNLCFLQYKELRRTCRVRSFPRKTFVKSSILNCFHPCLLARCLLFLLLHNTNWKSRIKVSSSDIWRDLKVEDVVPACVKRGQLRWFSLIRMPPLWRYSEHIHTGGDPGASTLGTLQILQTKLHSGETADPSVSV